MRWHFEGVLTQGATWLERDDQTAIDSSAPRAHLSLNTNLGAFINREATVALSVKTEQFGSTYGWNSPSIMGTKNGDCCSDIYWGWLDNSGRINVSAGAWGTPAKSTIRH